MLYKSNGNPNESQRAYDWKPEKPQHTKPDVKPVAKEIDGVLYYIGKGKDKKKKYKAVEFDRTWSVPKGIVKPNKTPYVRDRILY